MIQRLDRIVRGVRRRVRVGLDQVHPNAMACAGIDPAVIGSKSAALQY